MKRCVFDSCPTCKAGFNGPSDLVALAIERHQKEQHPDPFLVDAVEEVNAMGLDGGPLTVRELVR